MRIALKAEVEADLIVTAPVTVKRHPYTFEFFKENDKLWLKVSKPIMDYEEFLPKVYNKNGIVHFELGKDDIFKDLLEWLQYIEAMGSFNIQIDSIYWDRPTYCWVAETDDEHLQTPFKEYTRTPQRGRKPKKLSSSNLLSIVMHRNQLRDTYIPFTYFKEGQRFFNSFNYYFAYINFFMMLEYCFADGKFRQAEVVKKFSESKMLRMCILEFLTIPDSTFNDALWTVMEKECKRRKKELDVDGLIYVLMMLRGELSHASTISERRYRDDNELRPWVVIISTICFLVCGHLQIFGLSSENVKNDSIEKNIAKYRVMLDEKCGQR